MTIHLPIDLEHSIEAIVNSGRFASVDEAMAEAARRLLQELGQAAKVDSPFNANSQSGNYPQQESPNQWVDRLQAWVNTHPSRPISIDDSRESIYAGRGE